MRLSKKINKNLTTNNKNMKMKLLLLILVIFASGLAFSQTKVKAVIGFIQMTPDKIFIPSTNEYLYLARTANGEAYLYVSKTSELFERFAAKGSDSTIILDGAVFKPLQHYSKKQWKKLSKQIKMFFPKKSQKELRAIDMYLIFNYDVVVKNTESVSPTKPKPDPRSKGGKREVGPDGLPN